MGGDVSLPSQSQSSQPILPTVVVPSPPAILTNPEAEDHDEDLELPTLGEATPGSPSKKQKTGKKKKKPDDNDESPEHSPRNEPASSPNFHPNNPVNLPVRSGTGQALMAFHDASEHHEKEAIHGKLIQSDAVSEHNLSVATNHSLLATKRMAPVINPQHNPTYAILDNGCTRSMGSWHAIQRLTQAIEPMKDIISYQYIPAETTRQGKLDPASSISHNSSTQHQHRRP